MTKKQTLTIKETQPTGVFNTIWGTLLEPSIEYSEGWDDVDFGIYFDPYPLFPGYQKLFNRPENLRLEARHTGHDLPNELTVVMEKLDGTTLEVTGLKLTEVIGQEEERLVTYKAKQGEYTITEWVRGS